jgi:hypothetical protein
VVTDVITVGGTDTVGLEAIVGLGFSLHGNALILGEDGAYLEDTPRTPLAELTVAGRYGSRLPVDGHSHSSTRAFSGPQHRLNIS